MDGSVRTLIPIKDWPAPAGPSHGVTVARRLADAEARLANSARLITQLRDALSARNATIMALRGEVQALRASVPLVVPVTQDARRPMADIAFAVAKAADLTVADLRGRRITRDVSRPRQMAMYLMQEAGWSLPQIGRFLGGRDHTTVLTGIRAAKARLPGQRT